jgi:hypothetical protein
MNVNNKQCLQLEEQGIKFWEPEETQEFDTTMILTLKQVLSFALQVSYGMVRYTHQNNNNNYYYYYRNTSPHTAMCIVI